jgi:putative ABC transport system permease protein
VRSLRTVLSLALRESRFFRRRLFLFLSAISLGVAALVAVQGFSANLSQGVREQARALLGADVALESRQPFPDAVEALLDSAATTGAGVGRVTSFNAMALVPRTGGTRLVQVRGVEGGFPFYGEVATDPAGAWSRLQEGRVALVDPAYLTATGGAVGDTVAIGDTRFLIAGTLERVTGDVEVASAFAPRVYVLGRFIEETGLITVGSRVEYGAYLRLDGAAAAAAWVEANRPVLREARVRARTAADQQEMLTEALGRLGSYLGLVGVFALLLGGIGVASAMRAYMAQKAESVAVLRCLGATSGQVLAVYLIQAAAMGLLGSIAGAALGVAMQQVLPRLASGLLPVDVAITVDARSVGLGIAVGVWVAVAFALLPLMATRRVSPLAALRRNVQPLRAPRDAWRFLAWAALGGSVLLIAVLQVGSVRVGAGFAAGIAAALLVLRVAAEAAIRLVRRLRGGSGRYTLRQGLANLHRPGNQTATVVLALGFGVFLLATLFLAQHNVLRPLMPEVTGVRANLLLWDVQDDQAPLAAALLRDGGYEVLQRTPIVPMRIAALNGERVRGYRAAGGGEAEGETDADAGEDGERRGSGWAVRREYRSTVRDTAVASERIVAGEWWEPGSAGAWVSLERGVAEELNVGVGDRITWDVQGVEVPTTITSLREVDWARFEPNFFAVFHPSILEGAPRTWVLLTHVEDAGERARIQRDLVQRMANVAILDLTQLQRALDAVLSRVAAVVRFLALFSVATGFVVLLGAVATARLQRIRESVLLKTLGATRGQIASILATEYVAMGAVSAVVGVGASIVAGWALSRWLFRVSFSVPALPLFLIGLLVAALTGAIGVWGSREVFRRTALEAIREE